jgi:hypothetical protein
MIQFLTALKAMVTTGSQPQTIPLAAMMDACFASGLALALASWQIPSFTWCFTGKHHKHP